MKQLTILQTNDTHSYLESHWEHIYTAAGVQLTMAGGYARLKQLVKNFEDRRRHVLLLDNGDTFHGTYDAVQSQGWHMVPIMNAMGYDAMTFHWDAAYTPANLKEIGNALEFPILAINCYDQATQALYFEPYLLKDYGEFKVAVIGLAASIIDKTMPPKFSEGVYFTLGNEELPVYIEEVKAKGADLVILLSHNGFPQDVKMLQEIPGIDICISGHTHNRLTEPVQVGNAYIIQSGSHGSFLGKMDVCFQDKVQSVDHELISVTQDIAEDVEMKKLVDLALASNRDLLKEKVGESKELLHRATGLYTPMDNLLLKSLLHVTDAVIAFSNGWRYGAPIPPGEITLGDLYQIVPMNPPVSVCLLTGQEIWDMLEDNLKKTYAADPYEQMGGYLKRAMGLTVYLKIENPNHMRIHQIFIGEEELQRDRTYPTVYATVQGVPKKQFGQDHQALYIRCIDAIKQYLRDQGPFYDDTPKVFEVI